MGGKRVFEKIRFVSIIDGVKRAEWLKKKNILKGIGEGCLWQSRKFPMDPECILIHNNVTIAADVTFVTHDAIRHVLGNIDNKYYAPNLGCIEIMDNSFIGLGSIIMPNVRIGKNTIVAAGSIVTKDVPEGTIVAGCPEKVIGNFEEFRQKRILETNNNKKSRAEIIIESWKKFHEDRKNKDRI